MNADPRAPEYREAERKTAHQPVTPTPQARAVLRDTMSVTCSCSVSERRSWRSSSSISFTSSTIPFSDSRRVPARLRFRNGRVISEGVPPQTIRPDSSEEISMLELRNPDFLSTDFLVRRKGKSFAVWPADVDDQDAPSRC
jgi:hypothetical protein